jgi:HEAT repeat protein
METGKIAQLVRQIADTTKPLAIAQLYSLSDLSEPQLTQFRQAWPQVPVERRRQILGFLLEIAENNFEVDFEPVFRVCIDDADEEVRTRSVEGLWESEDVNLVAPLLEMLHSDPATKVRAAAAAALGRFVLMGELGQISPQQQAAIEDVLLALIRSSAEPPEVRRRAVEAVAFSCRDEVAAVIQNAYSDRERLMRVAAIFAMGRNLDAQWEPVLLDELRSHDPEFRYEAARACGELELTSAAPLLAELLTDEDREVQEVSIWALGQIGGQQARQILEARYQTADDDEVLLEAIEEALSEMALAYGAIQFPLYEYKVNTDDAPNSWTDDWLDGVLDDDTDDEADETTFDDWNDDQKPAP